jgi:two-component system, response regulator PdtaR
MPEHSILCMVAQDTKPLPMGHVRGKVPPEIVSHWATPSLNLRKSLRDRKVLVRSQSWPVIAPRGVAMSTVLIVEDEFFIRDLLKEKLEDAGYQVVPVPDADHAIHVLETRQDGLKLAAFVDDRWPPVHIIVTTGRAKPLSLPPNALFIPKPYLGSNVVAAMRMLRICREDTDQLVRLGRSSGLAKLSIECSQVSSVATPSDSSWLTNVFRAPDASASRAIGGRIIHIESMKSRSLAIASAGGRARAPWSVSRAAVASWFWFVLMDMGLSVCNLDETSISEQLRSQIRLLLAVCSTRNRRNNTELMTRPRG